MTGRVALSQSAAADPVACRHVTIEYLDRVIKRADARKSAWACENDRSDWDNAQFYAMGFVVFVVFEQKLWMSIDISVGIFYNKYNWNSTDLEKQFYAEF